MGERLQKIMARAGIGSRRSNEKLIAAGRVKVNGKVAKLGDSAEPGSNTHGLTPSVPLENADLTFDFGFIPIPLYAIGNLVWEDTDGNSIHEVDEVGIPNVVMELLDGSRAIVMTTTTNADGLYLFDNLPAGTYQTRIPPSNFLPTAALYHTATMAAYQVSALAGAEVLDDGNVGTGNATNGVVSSLVTLGDGTEPGSNTHGLLPEVPLERADLSLDFSFFHDPVYAAGNVVWEDLNENGVYDEATESGLSGVVVELLDNSGAVLITTTTNANGVYLFDNLLASSYQIRIPSSNFAQGNALYDTPNQTTYQPTIQKPIGSADDGMIGIGNVFDGVLSPIFTLGDGVEPGNNTHGITPDVGLDFADLTLDFGFVPGKLFAIGNIVFLDANNNSILDPATESGIMSVTVELLDDENVVIDTMLTDANGAYLFDELPASKYQIRIPGSNFTVGQPLYQPSTASPYQPSPIKDSAIIDDGSVGIGNSTDGVVSLLVVLGNGDEPGTDVHGITPLVPLNQADLTLDFGFVPSSLYAIGNFVFEEKTDHLNGIFEPAFETPIKNVLLELYDGPTLIMTTTTDENGAYLFDNLVEGTYTVKIPLANFIPPGALFNAEISTPMLVSPQKPITVTDDGMVGFGSPLSGIIATVRLGDAASEPGSNTHGLTPDVALDNADLTVDFGFYTPDATAVGLQQANTLLGIPKVGILIATIGLLLVTMRWLFSRRIQKE